MSRVQIVRCDAVLPDGIETLVAASQAEGYGFVARLRNRWSGVYDDGVNPPDARASVFAAFIDGELRAIGGQTLDSYEPSPAHRRIRHFYVLPEVRRDGVGRTLATALIHEAFGLAPRLYLRATHALSIPFWDAMGFARVDHPTRSHEMLR